MMEKAESSISKRRLHAYDSDFIGRPITTWDKVVEAVNEVWKDGVELVENLLRQVEKEVEVPASTEVRRRKKWSEDGDELCNDRLRGGQDAWLKTSRQRSSGSRQVTVIINLTTSCHVNPASIVWRGIVGICIADLLEREGYSVAVYGVSSSRVCYKDGSTSFVSFPLKEMGCRVSIQDMVNGVSGWFYRTVMFQAKGVAGKPIVPGLGKPRLLSEDEKEVKELTGTSKVILCQNVWSKEQAVELIKKLIKSLE